MPVVDGLDGRPRCSWATGDPSDPVYLRYHDDEWGRPSAAENALFEKLCLEGFQSGLSWLTILRKRPALRGAFAGFDIDAVAGFGDADIERLVNDARLVRHRGKIASTINNARRALELRAEFGTLAAYVWRWEPTGTPPEARPGTPPSSTAESVAFSRDLKRRGWTFVGPTTVYAFMQAMGLVNDHAIGCFCHGAVDEDRAGFVRPGS